MIGTMAISDLMTTELKRHVRETSSAISETGFKDAEGQNPDFYVWDVVRTALGKSYDECCNDDIPHAFVALEYLLERVKSETR